MAIQVRCSHCGKSLRAPDKLAGRTAPVRTANTRSASLPPSTRKTWPWGCSAAWKRPRRRRSPGRLRPASRVGRRAERRRFRDRRPTQRFLDRRRKHRRRRERTGRASLAASESSSRGRSNLLYLLFALALIPLVFSLLGESEGIESRLVRTLQAHPEALAQADQVESFDEFVELLPEGRIDGAHLSRDSWMHWFYALLAAAGFLGVIWVLFEADATTPKQLLVIGAATATGGIIFLLGVQWIAAATQGWIVVGRSIVVLFFYIIKFIGFSYNAAMDPENGFWLSFLGFTFGVGLCEELTKSLPVIFHYRGGGTMDWRDACMWGLASGIGFGVAEGIIYSSGHYNGLATGGIYVVRFISCVALHATWTAAASIMICRRRAWVEKDEDWSDLGATLLYVLAVPVVLHGLYDTLLKRDMNVGA